MKYLILIITLFSLNTIVFSQDSIKIRTEIDTFNTPQYESDYDAFFLKQEPQKFMCKLATSSILRDYGFLSSGFGIIPEFRLAKGVSLNVAFVSQTYYIKDEKIERNSTFNIPIQLYLEPRYYFNKRKEIAQKQSADNLIGNYLGIRTGVSVGPSIKSTYFAEAVLGSQQLFFLKTYRGLYKDYIDFNLGLGASYNVEQKWKPSYHFQVQLGGFFENFGNLKGNNAIPAMCDVFQCHIQEKRMFRVDLMNLINITNTNNLDGGIDINYEEKIGASTFSVNTGLAGRGYNFKLNAVNNIKIKGYSFKAYLEPRWYFKMKKEIANGTSANNLSGEYLALQLGYQNNEKNNYENSFLKTIDKSDYFYSYLIFGQQQRILKHFYIEMKGGLGVKSKKNSKNQDFQNSYFTLFSEIKIGLAF
jgi:hypothetical protein